MQPEKSKASFFCLLLNRYTVNVNLGPAIKMHSVFVQSAAVLTQGGLEIEIAKANKLVEYLICTTGV